MQELIADSFNHKYNITPQNASSFDIKPTNLKYLRCKSEGAYISHQTQRNRITPIHPKIQSPISSNTKKTYCVDCMQWSDIQTHIGHTILGVGMATKVAYNSLNDIISTIEETIRSLQKYTQMLQSKSKSYQERFIEYKSTICDLFALLKSVIDMKESQIIEVLDKFEECLPISKCKTNKQLLEKYCLYINNCLMNYNEVELLYYVSNNKNKLAVLDNLADNSPPQTRCDLDKVVGQYIGDISEALLCLECYQWDE